MPASLEIKNTPQKAIERDIAALLDEQSAPLDIQLVPQTVHEKQSELEQTQQHELDDADGQLVKREEEEEILNAFAAEREDDS